MATALSDGKIYLIESDAGDNDNWLATSTPPDPTDIDLDDFTEGTDYCKLKLPKQWSKKAHTGMKVEDASGGKYFVTRSSQKSYICSIIGLEVTGSDVSKIEQFFMDNDHTASSATTFEYYYMIIIRSATDYELFTDHLDVRQEYCKGVALEFEIIWNESKNRIATVRITFRSAWGAS